ncbi:chemotaxis protein CheB [bacterium]|nr:chemotaxis protein CheB [bacterium]
MKNKTIVIIGASAGGPRTLKQIFQGLPRCDCSIVLVQHMPQFVNQSIAQSLNDCTEMSVHVAQDGEFLKSGEMAVVPSEVHAEILHNRQIRLVAGERVNFVCPSVDVTMQSLQAEPGVTHIGIILTGMGRDGASGICHMKSIGARTIAQDQDSSVIFGMPKEAIDTGCVDHVCNPGQIHDKLIHLAGILR